MTQQDLRDEIWGGMPFARKRLVGRERVDDLITMSIESSPLDLLQHVGRDSREQDVVVSEWSKSVKRSYCLICGDEATFGPLFWILVSPLLQYIIKRLIEWWFESASHRVIMAGWKRELTK